MKILSTLVTSIILLSVNQLSGQDIRLSHENRVQTIKAGTFIEIGLFTPNQEPCSECPPLNTMSGKLISYHAGMLKMQVLGATSTIDEDSISVGYTLKSYPNPASQPVLSIPSNVILSITKKGNNDFQEEAVGDNIAIALGIVASGSLISSLYAENRDLIAIVGAAEAATAIALAVISKQKTYVTSEQCPTSKKKKRKIWKLE